jgi:hypothetical protein
VIAETRDPEIINHFASHPDIAPHIGGPLDFSHAIRETAVYLFGDHGGFCFEWTAPATYESHVMLTPAGRGFWGFRALDEAVRLMAERGADRLWCRVRPQDDHIAFFARRGGFREAGEMTLYSPARARWRILEWRKPCPQQ